MVRPKSISQSIDTDYFKGVQPIWTKPWLNAGQLDANGTSLFDTLRPNLPPNPFVMMQTVEGRAELRAIIAKALKSAGQPANRISEIWIEDISPEFHGAAMALAKWPAFGVETDAWGRSPDNAFMKMREVLIKLCNAWRNYDWTNLHAQHAMEREQQGAAHNIVATFARIEGFRMLDDDEGAVRERHHGLIGAPRWICEFQWRNVHQRLPQDHILLGLVLAVSVNRLVQAPQRPKTNEVDLTGGPSCGLPWVALAEFTSIAFDPDVTIEPDDFRKRVTALAGKVACIHTTPDRKTRNEKFGGVLS